MGFPYGASPTQLVRRLGHPSEKQQECWIYKVEDGAKTTDHGFGQYVDKVRYCFAEGATGGQAVSQIASHLTPHRIGEKHYLTSWSDTVIQPMPATVAAP